MKNKKKIGWGICHTSSCSRSALLSTVLVWFGCVRYRNIERYLRVFVLSNVGYFGLVQPMGWSLPLSSEAVVDSLEEEGVT